MENDEKAYRLKKLIEELTTSGKDKLNEVTFKQVKKLCKTSDAYVVELYKLVTKQLRKKHAEIRFSAFQICDEIFRRSHIFRELLLKDFNNFVDLVLGLNPKKPLPKPESVAKQLKQKSVEVIQQWFDDFGDGYVPLKLGYTYLRDCKRVDFAELTARTEAERQRAEEERQRTEEIKRKKIEKINNELEETSSEIQDCIVQFRNCFRLLIPDVHDFFVVFKEDEEPSEVVGLRHDEQNISEEGGFIHSENDEEENEDIDYGSEYMRTHGIMKGTNININLEDVRKLKETNDNAILIANLKEYVHILNTIFFPKVNSWEQTMRPLSEGNANLIKRILDIKQSVQSAVKMFESLCILPQEKPQPVMCDDSDTDDDDFIEVPMDDPRVLRAMESEAALLGVHRSNLGTSSVLPDDQYNQPSTSGISRTSLPQLVKGKNDINKLSYTPRCPDEYLSKVPLSCAPKRLDNPLAGLSQVWTATPDLHEQEDVNSTGGVLGVATQRVNYERAWQPVKWACRAPLKLGGLCPRKDREKCPFHGPIIPRDEVGKPLHDEDAAREHAAREQYEREHPAWQDPALLAELKAATGVDLKVTKGRRNRKRKYENLTDIRKTNSRDRLEKKIFSRKSIKRVNSALARENASAPKSTLRFGQG